MSQVKQDNALALADRIDRLLPQTQCTRCGYPACRPYAEAIADGRAAINQCPPGGDATIQALAELLQQPVLPLNTAHGEAHPRPLLAIIVEADCIGCTKCIQACPVDAIVGAAKQMHTVSASECTGCELCLPPCPVDCITLTPAAEPWDKDRAEHARVRYQARQRRLAAAAARAKPPSSATAARRLQPATLSRAEKQAVIAAAVARAKARKAQKGRQP